MTQKGLHLALTLSPQLLFQETSTRCSSSLYLPEDSPKGLYIFSQGPIRLPSSRTGTAEIGADLGLALAVPPSAWHSVSPWQWAIPPGGKQPGKARDVAVDKGGLRLMPSHPATQDICQPACLTKSTSSFQSPRPHPMSGSWEAVSLGRQEPDLAPGLRDPVGMAWPRCHCDMEGGGSTRPQVSSPPGSWPPWDNPCKPAAKLHPTGGDSA